MLLGGNVLKYLNLTFLGFWDLEIHLFNCSSFGLEFIYRFNSNGGGEGNFQCHFITWHALTYISEKRTHPKLKYLSLFRHGKNTHGLKFLSKCSFPIGVC